MYHDFCLQTIWDNHQGSPAYQTKREDQLGDNPVKKERFSGRIQGQESPGAACLSYRAKKPVLKTLFTNDFLTTLKKMGCYNINLVLTSH